MQTKIHTLLSAWGSRPEWAAVLAPLMTVLAIALLAAVLYALLIRILVPAIAALTRRTRVQWDDALVHHRVFHRLAALGPAILVHSLVQVWVEPGHTFAPLLYLAVQLWILVTGLLIVYGLLDALVSIYDRLPCARQVPIRGFVQAIKLLTLTVVLVIAVSLAMGKSPALLVSGLGAMTAVIMLIFKDPILGFVAGIQLSANRMLAVGDWLEMSKYDADGDVIDITLTTVKVRNWDKTITTIPTYALITDSFKNWRGMQETGGRRIARSLFIDVHTVRFLSPDDLDRLRKAQLISHYIEEKLGDIEQHNRTHDIDPDSPVNGRRLTNLGTFRAYVLAYLKAHPGIHPELTMMVRQLQPTAEGLPLQIYAFTRDTAWVTYEGVQGDIFDHLLAVIPEFGLQVYQAPSGSDVRAINPPRHAPPGHPPTIPS